MHARTELVRCSTDRTQLHLHQIHTSKIRSHVLVSCSTLLCSEPCTTQPTRNGCVAMQRPPTTGVALQAHGKVTVTSSLERSLSFYSAAEFCVRCKLGPLQNYALWGVHQPLARRPRVGGLGVVLPGTLSFIRSTTYITK